jgi:hypothetical protein
MAAEVWEQYKEFYPALIEQQQEVLSPSVVMGHLVRVLGSEGGA